MADRHMFRAEWHDYNDGILFVTVCTKDKKHLFGTITNDEMHKNALGTIVEECIKAIPEHHPQVTIHNYVIMPNHIHLIIATVGTRYIASASKKDNLLRPHQQWQCLFADAMYRVPTSSINSIFNNKFNNYQRLNNY